jgi:hypothetical protein
VNTSVERVALSPGRISTIDLIVSVCALAAGAGLGFLLALNPMGEMSQQAWSALVQNMTFGVAILAAFPCYMLAVRLHRRWLYVQGWLIWSIGFCLVGTTLGSNLSYIVTG